MAYTLGLSGVVLCTLLLPLSPWERRLDTSALPYLAVILAAGLLGGLAPATVTAVAAFLFFMDYVFVPAHYTFTLADPVDVIATIGFLGLSGFVAYLLHKSQAEAELARQREQEAARLREASTEAEIFRRSDELKSALLATVSHELGTPLAVIKAAARTLADGEVSHDPVVERELAAMIHREVDRLRALVTDLLDVSRIEGGALRLSVGWYDMGELVRESVARLRPRLGERVVEVDAPADMPVEVDYMLLERVIDNLVENAIRHAPVDRPVRITVRPDSAYLKVTVSDQGPGIPADDLDRVFEKFHRVEGRPGGVGLGLAICKGIVEEHGGSIWAESPIDEGRGFAVHFRIPWIPVSAPLPA